MMRLLRPKFAAVVSAALVILTGNVLHREETMSKTSSDLVQKYRRFIQLGTAVGLCAQSTYCEVSLAVKN